MSFTVMVEDARGVRRLGEAELPLALGGRGAGIELLGVHHAGPTAWIGLEARALFIQPAGTGEPVLCNGTPVSTSQWLHAGDVVRIGATRINVEAAAGGAHLRIEQIIADEGTEPPVIVASKAATPPAATPGTGTVAASEDASVTGARGAPVTAAPFQPGALRQQPANRRRRRLRPAMLLTWAALLLLGGLAWFLFTMRSVEVRIDPEPERVSFDTGLLGWRLGGRHLLRPGQYRLTAEKSGYRPLDVAVAVSRDPYQTYTFTLEELPGLLIVDTSPVAGAEIAVDGKTVAGGSGEPLEIAAGEHEIRVRARRHQEIVTSVAIRGKGETQTLKVELLPAWAAITFRSSPAGARLRVDDEAMGNTPVTTELGAGRHAYELTLPGHNPFRGSLEVVAGEPQTLPAVNLAAAAGRLKVSSSPAGAAVTVDGEYRGQTPLDMEVSPGIDHEVALSVAGHEPASRTVRVAAAGRENLDIELAPRRGQVEIAAVPADAALYVNGEARGAASQTLDLVAVPHDIEIKKEGYETHKTSVTPRPGFAQSVRVELRTVEAVEAEKTPPLIRTSQNHELVLIDGGSMRMGASRREPGRRANETLRDVELTRRFYLARREISNEQFREFQDAHLSGAAGGVNLERDDHPVVRVTWQDAALYCNWLSRKESLPPAYTGSGGTVVAVEPLTTGYRLPTEAEWAWAARFAGREAPVKFPWGETLPVPAGAGNYADDAAAIMLAATIPDYGDGHPATAAVGSFTANPIGIFNLGGNVAEWVHDVYTIYTPGAAPVRDPAGPREGELHVIRGSSWMDSSISELRLTFRDYGNKERSDLGFRIARYAE